MTRRTTFTASI